MKKYNTFIIAVFAIIGCCLPWVMLEDGSINGFQGSHAGVVVLIAAMVCALFSFANKKWALISSIVINSILLFITAILFIKVIKMHLLYSVGIGVYLIVLSLAAMIISNVMAMKSLKAKAN